MTSREHCSLIEKVLRAPLDDHHQTIFLGLPYFSKEPQAGWLSQSGTETLELMNVRGCFLNLRPLVSLASGWSLPTTSHGPSSVSLPGYQFPAPTEGLNIL